MAVQTNNQSPALFACAHFLAGNSSTDTCAYQAPCTLTCLIAAKTITWHTEPAAGLVRYVPRGGFLTDPHEVDALIPLGGRPAGSHAGGGRAGRGIPRRPGRGAQRPQAPRPRRLRHANAAAHPGAHS